MHKFPYRFFTVAALTVYCYRPDVQLMCAQKQNGRLRTINTPRDAALQCVRIGEFRALATIKSDL
jgi:hypothetical protein